MFGKNFQLQQLTTGVFVPLLVILAGGVAYMVLLPKYQEVRAVQELLETKKATFESRQASLSGVMGLVKNLETERDNLEVVENVLPTAPRIPELLANFDFLAGQSGLLISRLQITLAPSLEGATAGSGVEQIQTIDKLRSEANKLAIMQTEIGLKGNYINIKTFLLNLEQNLRLMDPIELVFGEVESSSGLQEYSLKILVYYQLE